MEVVYDQSVKVLNKPMSSFETLMYCFSKCSFSENNPARQNSTVSVAGNIEFIALSAKHCCENSVRATSNIEYISAREKVPIVDIIKQIAFEKC